MMGAGFIFGTFPVSLGLYWVPISLFSVNFSAFSVSINFLIAATSVKATGEMLSMLDKVPNMKSGVGFAGMVDSEKPTDFNRLRKTSYVAVLIRPSCAS